jgi:hypothetical protein
MKKIWLPYPLYFLKPFAIALVGLIILHVSEDLFTTGLAFICLGYAAWIIFMRLMWSIKRVVKSRRSDNKKDKTYTAHFPD